MPTGHFLSGPSSDLSARHLLVRPWPVCSKNFQARPVVGPPLTRPGLQLHYLLSVACVKKTESYGGALRGNRDKTRTNYLDNALLFAIIGLFL